MLTGDIKNMEVKNMKKASLIIIITFMATCFSSVSMIKACSSYDSRFIQPIFEGEKESPIFLLDSKETRSMDVKKEPIKGLRSKKILYAEECWVRKQDPGGIVYVKRWYFQNAHDALLWPEIEDMRFGFTFREWPPKKPEVGDKDLWMGENRVLFAKGKVIVRVEVNSKKLGKEFTIRVAKNIAQKL
jgi:hypothetical protein